LSRRVLNPDEDHRDKNRGSSNGSKADLNLIRTSSKSQAHGGRNKQLIRRSENSHRGSDEYLIKNQHRAIMSKEKKDPRRQLPSPKAKAPNGSHLLCKNDREGA
jgi:hypothetical protein